MQELEKILEEINDRFENLTIADDECRKTALSKHNYEQVKYFQNAMFYTERAKGIVEEIIRKHTNDGWIPVEERLPERTPDEKINNSYKKYLVFIENIDYWDIDIAVYDLWNDKKWREFSNTYCEIENVTAWCPLPDPYKKIQEENK